MHPIHICESEKRKSVGVVSSGIDVPLCDSFAGLLNRATCALESGMQHEKARRYTEAIELYLRGCRILEKVVSGFKLSHEKMIPFIEDKLIEFSSRTTRLSSLCSSQTKTILMPCGNSSSHNTGQCSSGHIILPPITAHPQKLSSSLGRLSVKSSMINGRCFPEWGKRDYLLEMFDLAVPYRDPDGDLVLSSTQTASHAVYVRPKDFMTTPTMIVSLAAWNGLQRGVGDCSLVSALCVAANMEHRTGKKLISSIIYPKNADGVPVYNPSGKYVVILFYNGVPRKVVIDDRLPLAPHEGLLCAQSIDPNELWVSLIEKAYMKLSGGYDFPGSAPDVDLHALTSWIPECILLGSIDDDNAIWERIVSAHEAKNGLIVLSTGALTQLEKTCSGFQDYHSFAVLNVVNIGNERLLQLQDPTRGKQQNKLSRSMMEALHITDEDVTKMEAEGTCWIDFGHAKRYFNCISINCIKITIIPLFFIFPRES